MTENTRFTEITIIDNFKMKVGRLIHGSQEVKTKVRDLKI